MLRKLLVASAIALAGIGCSNTREKRDAVEAALQQALASKRPPPYVTPDAEGRRLWKLTRQFYERRETAPAWITGTSPGPQMAALISALHATENDGLDPQLYNVSLLDQRRRDAEKGFLTKKGFNPAEAGALDAWLTYLYLKLASDLADGLSDLAQADPNWQIRGEKFDPVEHLDKALEDHRVAESLADLTPENPQYLALRQALSDYRAQAAKGGWPHVPAKLKLRPGQKSPQVAIVAKRLAASGDYTGNVPSNGQSVGYGHALQEAVKRFQRRHGLTDDGIVGAGVVAEMNVPIETRIRQIELNLERWRWLPRSLGTRYILVNIPEYLLEVWDRGKVPVTMKVVVGKADTPTPIFNDEMTYVVFSPYWNVPPDIAQGETLPELLKDPGFLDRANMEVIDKAGQPVDPSTIDLEDPAQYRFRQRPGTGNSLGLVKFMFPNQYNVYLHDTPADSLFARASRSFSHGCVRVEQPEALAAYVLADQPEWTPDRIREAMNAEEERTVKLRSPLPVYLGYWTARVSADGAVQFRKDVYGIDARQTARLAERLNRLRKSAAAAALAANHRAAAPLSGGNSTE